MAPRIPINQLDDMAIVAANAAKGNPDPLKKAAEKAHHHKHGKNGEDVDGKAISRQELEAQLAAEQAARDAANKTPFIDKALGSGQMATGIAGTAVFGADIVGGVGSVPTWIAEKTKGKKFMKPVSATTGFIGKVMQAPAKFFGQTFSELGGKMGGVGKAIGKGTQAVADAVAPVVEGAASFTGTKDRRLAKHFGKAQLATDKAVELAEKLDFESAHPAVRQHLKDMHAGVMDGNHEKIVKAQEAINEALAGKAAGKATAAVEKQAVKVTEFVGGHTSRSLPEVFSAPTGGAAKAAEEVAAVAAKDLKPFAGFMKQVEDVAHHSAKAKGWKNIGQAVKNVPKSLGKAGVGSVVMNGSFIAMSGISMVQDTRSAAKDLHSLKQMYADMTGEKVENVSTTKVLLGKAPAPVAEARSYLIKNYGLKQLADVANIAINVAMVASKKFGFAKSMLAFGGLQLFTNATDAVMGENALPVYQAFRDAHAQSGGNLPAEYYAAFIGTVSPELRARGGAESAFAKELGEKYAAEKTTPKQMLEEIENGKLMTRVHELIKANAARKTAAGVASGNREVVGKHTAMLQQQSGQQQSLNGRV